MPEQVPEPTEPTQPTEPTAPTEPAAPDFVIAFARGVVPTKWFRVWEERYPEVRLGSFRTDSADQLRALRADLADMSIVRNPADTTGLRLIPLYREIAVVVAPKDHEIGMLEEVTLDDLRGIPLLENPDALPDWPAATVPTYQPEPGTAESGTTETYQTIEDTIELVAAGIGLVVVPQSIARLHARKDLIYRPLVGVSDTEVGLAWLQDNEVPEVEDFIGVVRGRTARSSRGSAAEEAPAPKPQKKKTPPPVKKKTPPPVKKKPGPRPFGTSRRPGGAKGRKKR